MDCLFLLVWCSVVVVVVIAYQQEPPIRSRPTTTSSLNKSQIHDTPTRPLQPPFPNGPCGGRVVTIAPESIFGEDDSSILIPPRPIHVWLPPHYDNFPSNEHGRFPVLYCHDGQNVMEDADSWTGASWRLTGGLTRLAERGLLRQVPIVVMIPSATDDVLLVRRRHLEYGAVGQVFAEAHADLVANTLKPYIDSTFDTWTEPQHTFCMGTSLGGQASLHLLLRHPSVFGGAACLSPCFQQPTLSAVLASNALQSKRIYMDMGGDMGQTKVPLVHLLDHLTSRHWWNPGYFWLDTQLQAGADAMSLALQQKGIHHRYHKQPGARHNERAWAQRIHLPLLHLFGKQP